MLFNLSEQNSIANQFLFELRDESIQRDRMRFRKNIERLGELMAYEVSKRLAYIPRQVKTPLGTLDIDLLARQPVLLTIMRAGLPFLQGFLNFFDLADSGFIGAYRQEDEKGLAIELDYVSTPDLTGKDVILVDPMLATGRSVIDSLNLVLKKGTPSHVHVVALIAAPEGIRYVQEHLSIAHSLWVCALDEKLNDLFYIVPGLGDAGDLSYGKRN